MAVVSAIIRLRDRLPVWLKPLATVVALTIWVVIPVLGLWLVAFLSVGTFTSLSLLLLALLATWLAAIFYGLARMLLPAGEDAPFFLGFVGSQAYPVAVYLVRQFHHAAPKVTSNDLILAWLGFTVACGLAWKFCFARSD